MKLNQPQRKALSEFANTVAAAWFTAGIITPFFTKPTSIIEFMLFLTGGLSMTSILLWCSLKLVKGNTL